MKQLFKEYDPAIGNEEYEYRNFGYFALMDDSWVREKDALFPELAYSVTENLDEKFTTFAFEDRPECWAIREELGDRATILHYLQDIYERIQKGDSFKDEYFEELHRIFMCGKRPDGISGFFNGAVVSFKNGGFLKKFDRSVLNDLYPAVRPFSPWTGKTFAKTTVKDIKKEKDFAYIVLTQKGYLKSRYIINAAGLFADEIAWMVGDRDIRLTLTKGTMVIFLKIVLFLLLE